MSVFSNFHFRDHESVAFGYDPVSGLRAIVAVHNTSRGVALGGCRVWPYASEDEALTDVLRLSRGMTYKSAMADLPLGGGKAVIIADPHEDKSDAMMQAMGKFVQGLGGRYITAEDSGTNVADLRAMARQTRYVVGIAEKRDMHGNPRSGDPSPATAYGVFSGIAASVKDALNGRDLRDIRVAIQGLGSVGWDLARRLHEAGARLWVTDIHSENLVRARQQLNAEVTEPERIFDTDVEVFAPCALGAILDDETIPRLKARVVAGAANNQLAEDRHGEMLRERGILYAPDYVINAGGIIDVAYEWTGYDAQTVWNHIARIADTLRAIYARASRVGAPTSQVADRMAEERFQRRRSEEAA